VESAVGRDTEEFITGMELTLLGEVHKDRKDPKYKATFDLSLTAVKQLSPNACHAWLVKTAKHLKELPAERAVKKHAKRAEELVAAWKAPKDARDAGETKEAAAQ